jgi:hypothetical protein
MTKQQLRIKTKNLVMLITKYNLSTGEALELQKVAGSLHRLNENACNYGLTDRQETRQHNLYRKATEIIGAERTAGQELYGPFGTWTIGCGHKGTEGVFRLGPVQTPGCLHTAALPGKSADRFGCDCLCHGGSPVAFIREQRDPRGWPLDISLEPMNDSTQYDQVCPF